MGDISAFVRELASYHVQQECHKPLLGKPFVKYGQCLAMAGYFFQLGGVLGGLYRDKQEEFVLGFLGLRGESGAVDRFYSEVARAILPRVAECSSINDYVLSSEAAALDFSGDPSELFLRGANQKIGPETAAQMCWDYAQYGAALGTLHPHHFKRLFGGAHRKADEEEWRLARASGLSIPEQQDVMTYEGVEQEGNDMFLSYLRQYAPHLYASLSSV